MGGNTSQQQNQSQNLVDEYTQKLPEGDKYFGFENVSALSLTLSRSPPRSATQTQPPRSSSTASPSATQSYALTGTSKRQRNRTKRKRLRRPKGPW